MLVINGATCNGTDHSGCGHIAATVTVGLGAYGVAVDDETNTVYVANNQNGFAPGTLSIINSATCNGHTTTGVRSTPPPPPLAGRHDSWWSIQAPTSSTSLITEAQRYRS